MLRGEMHGETPPERSAQAGPQMVRQRLLAVRVEVVHHDMNGSCGAVRAHHAPNDPSELRRRAVGCGVGEMAAGFGFDDGEDVGRSTASVLAIAFGDVAGTRLTVDTDGTVVCTGLQVERAFRGYNPHHRKDHSYYPVTAHLAQTGHLLRVQNRSGNVYDGKAGLPFLRDLFAQIRHQLGRVPLEIRLDGAFFRDELLAWLESRARYAVKVPFYQWARLKPLILRQRRWTRIASEIQGFDTPLWLEPWKRFVRVAIYRKRAHHESPKNYQLDLSDPGDGHWEYSAIATNHTLGLRALWHFMAGRGAHEKVLAELKNGYAFDAVPTRSYAANSAWQILSTLAHNLVVSFQLALGAPRRRRSLKRTALYALKSIHTLRYEFLARAGIVQYPHGRATLTLSRNLLTRGVFQRLAAKLASSAAVS